MKTLVLGATGIIGNHIVRNLLQHGHEVFALSRGITSSRNLQSLNVKIITADLQDVETLKRAFVGMDWVFHAAGYYPKSAFGMDGHVAVAMAQTDCVIRAAQFAKIKRLIYTSSLTTIGQVAKDQLADETCEYNLFGRDPHPYFRLKYLIEEEFKKAYHEKDLPVVMLNPTGCFGPYELKPRELCLMPQLAHGKIPAYVSNRMNVVDVADVAQGHVLAAEKGRLGERYILGAHNTTTPELMREICDVIGVTAPRFRVPFALALALAYSNEILHAFTGVKVQAPVLGLMFAKYGQHFSSEKAKRELGYTVHDMRPCYERALSWYREIGYI